MQTYSCRQIRDMLMEGQPNLLAVEADRTVVPELSRSSIFNWQAPVKKFLALTEGRLKQKLHSIVADSFSDYHQTQLPGRINDTIDSVLETAVQQAQHLAKEALENEYRLQLTLDTEGLEAARRQCLEVLERRGLEQRIIEVLESTEGKKTEGLDRRTKVKAAVEKEKNNMGPHPYQREIGVMAHVQGYYKIAANRFVDFIVLTFDRYLFSVHVAADLAEALEQLMGLNEGNGTFHPFHTFSPAISSLGTTLIAHMYRRRLCCNPGKMRRTHSRGCPALQASSGPPGRKEAA